MSVDFVSPSMRAAGWMLTYYLTCWHCGNSFWYTPPVQLQHLGLEQLQGYTVCEDCVSCMPKCIDSEHNK